MPTIEERLQALEQEYAQLKKITELQNIAIGALANNASLEELNEKYDRIFEAQAHMAMIALPMKQVAELRQHQTEEDGKIVEL